MTDEKTILGIKEERATELVDNTNQLLNDFMSIGGVNISDANQEVLNKTIAIESKEFFFVGIVATKTIEGRIKKYDMLRAVIHLMGVSDEDINKISKEEESKN